MPWGPPDNTPLSASDQQIISSVQASCRELMDRLGDLDTYVTALNSELGQRNHGGDQVSRPLPPPDRERAHILADEMLAERADQLAATVSALRASVAALDERAQHVEERATAVDKKATRTAKANRRAIIALVIVALFTGGFGWLVLANRSTVSRLDEVQQQGISLRQDTLCPILQTALAGDTPQARATYPAGPVAYDVFIAKLRHGVDAMRCTPLTGGR